MKRYDTNTGKPVHRAIEVRVVAGKFRKTYKKIAEPGRAFTDEGVEEYLHAMSDAAEKKFPEYAFSLVVLGNATFVLSGTILRATGEVVSAAKV
jgi:uncharacterized protein YejL (UPF0352 family)